MSEFRDKLEKLFIKWLDAKDAPNLEQIKVMVKYAKISPEQNVDPLGLFSMMMEGLPKPRPIIEPIMETILASTQIKVNDEIVDMILNANPDLVDKIVVTRDTQGNALALRIN